MPHLHEQSRFSLGKAEPGALLGSINNPLKFMPWMAGTWASAKSAAVGPATSDLTFYTGTRRFG
jgi:hypothetical protein